MGFGTPPTVLEGDYSDWTIYDTVLDTDARNTHGFQEAYFNKLETEILIIDYFSSKVKKYTIDTKTLSTATTVTLDSSDTDILHPGQSVQGTYISHHPVTGGNVYVWKNGILTKTFVPTDLGILAGGILGSWMSPSGKYIVVCGKTAEPDVVSWVVLVGS